MMTEKELMTAYSPERQGAVTRDEREVFCGQGPTLRDVARTLGRDTVRAWLLTQFRDLARFAGSAKLTDEALVQTADVVASVHQGLKVAEVMYFCLHMKAGRWGDYFALANGLQITSALQLFLQERSLIMARLEEEERKRRQREEEARPKVTGLAAYQLYRQQCIAQGRLPFMEQKGGMRP